MVTLRGTAEGWLSLFSTPGDDVTGKLELLLSFLGGDDADAADGNGDDAFPFSLREEDVLLLLLLDTASLFCSLLGEDAARRESLDFSLHGDCTVFCSLVCGDVPLLGFLLGDGVAISERELLSSLDISTGLSLASWQCVGGGG